MRQARGSRRRTLAVAKIAGSLRRAIFGTFVQSSVRLVASSRYVMRYVKEDS